MLNSTEAFKSQIYRLLVIWNHNYYVIILPCLVLVASTGTSQRSRIPHYQHCTNVIPFVD
jgi:hypothetical protein